MIRAILIAAREGLRAAVLEYSHQRRQALRAYQPPPDPPAVPTERPVLRIVPRTRT